MKVISKFSHPEDVKEIESYLIKKGYSINCNLEMSFPWMVTEKGHGFVELFGTVIKSLIVQILYKKFIFQ